MSTHRHPEVFISATSADLRSCREMIKQALLTLQCVPVEQTNFPPDYRTVRDMLRAKIAACDAVVHLAGVVYGAEPSERVPGEPRRSYTQLEYDLARELKKPLYVFVCGEDFAYDEHATEDDEKRALQQAHRAALSTSETLRYKVASREDLALRVRELQTKVESLGTELQKTRSWLGRGVALGLAAVFLLGTGLWWLYQRTNRTETRLVQVETELDKQRRYIRAAADEFVELQRRLRTQQLTDEQIFDHAVASVAAREKLPEADLRAGIEFFVAATRRNQSADDYDRALASFAARDFPSAANYASQAAAAAKARRLAGEKLAAEGLRQAGLARAQELEAHLLQGKSLYAQDRFADAAAAFRSAAEVARPDVDEYWVFIQYHLATALSRHAEAVPQNEADTMRQQARLAYEAVRKAGIPELSEAAAYNQAVLELAQGLAMERDRLQAWRRAENLFSQLDRDASLFRYRQRDVIWRGRYLAEFLLADEFGGSLRTAVFDRLDRLLWKKYDLLQAVDFNRGAAPAARAPLYEIHAALLVAQAEEIGHPADRGGRYVLAEDLLKDAIPFARQQPHLAVLKNDLGLIQTLLAANGWGRGTVLTDPDTGAKVQALESLSPTACQALWETALANLGEALAALSPDRSPQQWATVSANRGITRIQQASTLPAGGERHRLLLLAQADLDSSLALARARGFELDQSVGRWLEIAISTPSAPNAATAIALPSGRGGRYLWHANYILVDL